MEYWEKMILSATT